MTICDPSPCAVVMIVLQASSSRRELCLLPSFGILEFSTQAAPADPSRAQPGPCGAAFPTAMEEAVVEHTLPHDIYYDALEERLLWESSAELLFERKAIRPPYALALVSRNDLCEYAASHLQGEYRDRFIRYTEDLSRVLPGTAAREFPCPLASQSGESSQADRFALAALQEGSGSLWSTARLVTAHLDFSFERRQYTAQAQRIFRAGAYCHRAFSGISRSTRANQSVCLVLNSLVKALQPDHTWSSIAVTHNNVAGPHTDPQNSRVASLAFGLSFFSGGELWVQSSQGGRGRGCMFEDCNGELLPGFLYGLSARCISFPSATHLHCVRPWASGDRYVLIAYTIASHKSLSSQDLSTLAALGFQLPPS